MPVNNGLVNYASHTPERLKVGTPNPLTTQARRWLPIRSHTLPTDIQSSSVPSQVLRSRLSVLITWLQWTLWIFVHPYSAIKNAVKKLITVIWLIGWSNETRPPPKRTCHLPKTVISWATWTKYLWPSKSKSWNFLAPVGFHFSYPEAST